MPGTGWWKRSPCGSRAGRAVASARHPHCPQPSAGESHGGGPGPGGFRTPVCEARSISRASGSALRPLGGPADRAHLPGCAARRATTTGNALGRPARRPGCRARVIARGREGVVGVVSRISAGCRGKAAGWAAATRPVGDPPAGLGTKVCERNRVADGLEHSTDQGAGVPRAPEVPRFGRARSRIRRAKNSKNV